MIPLAFALIRNSIFLCWRKTGEKKPMNNQPASPSRCTVRHFDPDHKMTNKEIEKLLSLALNSPTALNIQNWRFVVVRNEELRHEIRNASWDQTQVTEASLLVVLCTNLKAWEKESIRYWRAAPEPVHETVVPAIENRLDGLDRVLRDEAMRSCGITAQILMQAANSMGYDSCPMDGFDFEAVADLINLPENHAICMFVAIGKSIDESESPKDKLPMSEMVIIDTF